MHYRTIRTMTYDHPSWSDLNLDRISKLTMCVQKSMMIHPFRKLSLVTTLDTYLCYICSKHCIHNTHPTTNQLQLTQHRYSKGTGIQPGIGSQSFVFLYRIVHLIPLTMHEEWKHLEHSKHTTENVHRCTIHKIPY